MRGERFPFRRRFIAFIVPTCIVGMTLMPIQGIASHESQILEPFGMRGVADAVLNILLFFPLGIAYALQFSGIAAIGSGLLVSVGVETSQMVVPGRYSSGLDVLFNGVGTALGTGVVRWSSVLTRPNRRVRPALIVVSLAGGMGILLGSAHLLSPYASADKSVVEWTPAVQHQRYEGKVALATLGTQSLSPGESPVGNELLRGYVRGTDTLRVRFATGAVTDFPVILLRVTDPDGAEVLVVGIRSSDMTFRYGTHAAALRFDQAELRISDVLRGVRHGEEVDIQVWRAVGADCLQAQGNKVCVNQTLGRTWAILLHPVNASAEPIVTVSWLAMLFVPAGFWIRGNVSLVAASAVVILLLGKAHHFGPFAPAPAVELIAAVVGLMAGYFTSRRFRAALKDAAPSSSLSTAAATF